MNPVRRAAVWLTAALTLALGLASALGAARDATLIGYAQRAPERFDLFSTTSPSTCVST
ncbi:MAG: hypothetical protein IPK19_13940 [Chloroflexi bacterium]|nr:hypothetical protein [Chloroflexota bacterium]